MLYNVGNIASIRVSFLTAIKVATWAKTEVSALKLVASMDKGLEVYRDIHRIGGGTPNNLQLKPPEQKLSPPGISVFKGGSPADSAQQIKKAFPNASVLHEAAKVVGSTNEELIRSAGFDIMFDPTKKFPNHHRITHPNGLEGFNNENLSMLSDVFIDIRLED